MSRARAWAGGLLIALALLASLFADLPNIERGGSADMRNRITGARLLVHHIDPYRFIWHAGDPADFCDTRNNPHLPVSKTTVSPAMLVLHLPLATLRYRQAQFVWFFAQWLTLLGIGALWLRAAATQACGWMVALFVTAFTCTEAWRWEAERGQAYALLSFLFAWWLTRTGPPPRRDFTTGLIVGVLVALRPPFALLLPFLLLHRRGQFAGAMAGLLAGVALPLLIEPSIWNDYFSAMQAHSDLYRHAINPPHGPQPFPAVVEGTPIAILSQMILFAYGDLTIYALARPLGFGALPGLPPLLILAALFALWLWATRQRPPATLLPGLAAWLFLADFFLPTTRYGYYDVMILNVVLAGIAVARRFPWNAWPAVPGVIAGWMLYGWPHPPSWLLYASPVCFTLTALAFLIPVRTDGESHGPAR